MKLKPLPQPVVAYTAAHLLESWSYSRLIDFERCNLYGWLKHGARIKDPTPNPYAERGVLLHTSAERYVLGEVPELNPELKEFAPEFKALRAKFKNGSVSLEGEWGFDKDWNPVPWKDAWGRMKLDAIAWLEPDYALVIDYKSGKRFGNEIKHGEQMQLYQLGVFTRYAHARRVKVELWYPDAKELIPMEFTRESGLRHLGGYNRRALRMTEAKSFPARPNIFSCARCPYGPWGTGDCKVGVRAKQ